MLTIKRLTFSDIGRFVEEQSIDFTTLGSLVQVDGDNRNTGGSSGSGKSTIFKALEFLLGLNDISNTVLQSRLTKEPMSVTGEFDFDGLPLKIERGRKLSIDLNGEVTTGSSKLTEEKLDEIIGMDRDLFRKIIHKRQGEGGFFLDLGPSETHKFLTNCLGLQNEQTKIVTLDARLASLLDQELSLKTAVESLKSALQATESAISSLGPSPILDLDPTTIEELKNKYLEAANDIKLSAHAHKANMEALERIRPQITSIPFDRSSIDRLENEIKAIMDQIILLEDNEKQRCLSIKSKISDLQIETVKLNNSELTRQSEAKNKISHIQLEIQKLEQVEKDRQRSVESKINQNKVEYIKAKSLILDGERAKEEATQLAGELKKVRASICPTCEQSWINDAAKAKEAFILQKLSEHKKTIIAGMEASKKALLLEEDRKALEQEILLRSVPEIQLLNEKIEQLKLDSKPKIVPEIMGLNEKIEQLKISSQPQSIPEAIELKLKIDFKNQELTEFRKLEREHQFKENARSQLIVAEFNQKQTELRQSYESIAKALQERQDLAKSEYESANNKIENYKEAKQRFEESSNRLQTQLLGYSEQLKNKDKELGLVQEEIELANESKKAIKSYLSCSFEDALDSIGDTATRLIRAIPNMSTSTIQFEGLKENKEGRVKEEVTCLISMDGEIGIPVKSLSGGERSAVDIGIDLAVIKFIEERTGHGTDLFVLDEAFNGLDTTCIEDAIEMLRNCSVDKRLFLVEHNPVIAQSIENKIVVVRDGQTSRVVQQ